MCIFIVLCVFYLYDWTGYLCVLLPHISLYVFTYVSTNNNNFTYNRIHYTYILLRNRSLRMGTGLAWRGKLDQMDLEGIWSDPVWTRSRDILVNMFLCAYWDYICKYPESYICINITRENIGVVVLSLLFDIQSVYLLSVREKDIHIGVYL